MAANKIQDGEVLRLAVGSTVNSGDPVSVGNAYHGVALTDYDSVDGKASVALSGVYDLSVQAVDDAGNSGVAIGDRLYYGGSATPWLSKKRSGKFFGVALETVTTGTTATINVSIAPAVGGPDNSSHQIIAAGIQTATAGDAVEAITILGVLATDVVLATMSVNGATTKDILSAIASTDTVTITASAIYVAGDKINYAVLRAAV